MKVRELPRHDNVASASLPFDIDPLESAVEIHYSWSPAEPQTWNYPGVPATIEVTAVMLGKLNILPDVMDDEALMQYFTDLAWDAEAMRAERMIR